MAYTDFENSAASGQPVECYKFSGTYTNYCYTSSDVDVILDGVTYSAVPITRSEINVGTQEADNLNVELEVPSNSQLILDYAFNISPPALDLTIYRFHRGDSEAIVLWKSQIEGFHVNGHVTKIRAPGVFETYLNGNAPTEFWQSSCNNALFDGKCKLSRAAYSFQANILAIVDRTVQVTVLAPHSESGWYAGGEVLVMSSGERRSITNSVADTFSLSYPFSPNVKIGDLVEITVGCNHLLATCRDKFANSVNFGGQPYIPNTNPFIVGF